MPIRCPRPARIWRRTSTEPRQLRGGSRNSRGLRNTLRNMDEVEANIAAIEGNLERGDAFEEVMCGH